MSDHVLTIVVNAEDPTFDSALAAAVNDLQSNGHTVVQVRQTTDAGEVVIPVNTIEGVEPPPASEPTEDDVPEDSPPEPLA